MGIKMRCWDKKNKGCLSTGHFRIDGDGDLFINEYEAWERFNDFEYQVSIGAKDKEGKEIYVGDIIIHFSKNSGLPHEVVFYDGAFCGEYSTHFGEYNTHLGMLRYRLTTEELKEISVVGNKFENPEVLQIKK